MSFYEQEYEQGPRQRGGRGGRGGAPRPGFGPGFGPGAGPAFGPGRGHPHLPPRGGWLGPGFGPGFGRGGFAPPWLKERGGRARRGDVRAAVLALLAERPMHGYEIISELESRTNGVWRPSPGSVYPTLQLLEDEGLVTAAEVEGKRTFSITDAGRSALTERGDRKPPWEEVNEGVEPEQFQMVGEIRQLVAAVHQVSVAGSPEQHRQAQSVLAEARRKLYAILAAEA